MIAVDLVVGSRYPLNRRRLRERVITVLTEHRITHGQVAISVVGTRKIKELNEGLLKHEGITDVLSFPQQNSLHEARFPDPEGIPPHLGDIVICFPVAVQQAKRYGKRVDDQLCFYAEHGLLHLLGYHHDE
jgi:probable rRNA maturation factor